MEINDVDHVEFYVSDARQTASYLCDAFGFRLCGKGGPETGLAAQRSLLLRQGRVQLLLTCGLTADHPATAYVARHGDGVAKIAIGVVNARQAFEEAVERGAVPVSEPTTFESDTHTVTVAEVGGFGDVTHPLVERTGGSHDHFLPGRITAVRPHHQPEHQLLTEIDHVAGCLPGGSHEPTVDYYRTALGFDQIFEEYIEVGNQAMVSKVVQSRSGTVTLTFLEPDATRAPGQIDSFLAAHGGPGVQHLAFLTGDIVTAVRTLSARGVQFLATPSAYYDQLADRLGPIDLDITELRSTNVLVDRDHWGELFQIFTQSAHPRRTYFTEVIDRHGARTFGSRNIRALYQALQCDRAPATGVAG